MHHRTTHPSALSPNNPYLPGIDPLLTAREAAAYRRQGLSTFWRQVKLGQVPKPIYITPRSPRWRLSDLCPQRPVVTPNN